MQESRMAELSQRAEASLANGQVEEARKLYTRLSELDSNNKETWLILAAIQGESGDLSAALQSVDKAVSIDPDYAEAHLTRAHLLERLYQVKDAIASAQKAVEADNEYGEAWLFLGGLAGRLERPDAAEWAERAVRLLPGSSEALIILGNTYYQQGLFEEAETAFRNADRITPGFESALKREPDDVVTLDNLGNCYANLGRREEAIVIFDKILERQKGDASAYKRVARLFSEQGDYEEAIEYLRRGRQNVVNPLEILGDLAEVYRDCSSPQLAIQTCNDALELAPGNFEARFYKALCLGDLARYEEALAELDLLGQEAPEDKRIIISRAGMLERLGEYDKAHEQILPFLDEKDVPAGAVEIFARLCRRFGECDKAIRLMERALAAEDLIAQHRRGIMFTLGRVLDQQGIYESAFAIIEKANEFKHSHYDHRKFVAYVDRLKAPDVTGLIVDTPLSDAIDHGVRPVFIVGMPRSGTSLVEQIIASHPLVFGGGERHEISLISHKLSGWKGSDKEYPECLADVPPDVISSFADGYVRFVSALSPGVAVITDKMPENYRHLVLIRLLFPEARIIHCTRDPVDTSLSCYFQEFACSYDFSYDLADLGAHYVEYKRLMDYYRDEVGMPMLEVSYEEMVADTERLTREIIDYCALDWDEQCLRYYESGRVMRTASYDQVKQPIYTRSIGRWKHYERHLEPLKKALEAG